MSDETKPCSNGFCWLRCEPITGQHTNGPCNCLRDVPLPLQQAIKRKITSQREEITRLTAERADANQRADEARQESIVADQEAYEAVDDAMKAAKASHNDLRITMPEIAKMNALRWPWLEEME